MRVFSAVILLCLFSVSVSAEVSDNLSYKFYEAQSEPGKSLLEILNGASPIRHNGEIFHGYTQTNIEWNYRWNEEPNGRCTITGNTTNLIAEITLPTLVSSIDHLRFEFSQYIEPLRRHELGHYKMAQDAAKKIDAAILSLPPMVSCKSLEQVANRRAQGILDQANEESRIYDEITRHGRTQGAWLR
jgi:predicted secreted Zn-dependent protease